MTEPREPNGAGVLPEESAEELYEEAPVGYLSSLPDGLIARVNATLLAWTGYERDDLVGRKRLYDLLSPGAKIYYETHYAPLLHLQGSVREIAVELVRADGRRLPVLLNSTLVVDADGAPRVVRTTVFDATDRRRYEQELLRARTAAEERARAALALEHVIEGVLLVGPEGRIGAANAAVQAMLGLEDWAGRRVAEALPEWDALAPRVPVAGPGEPARRVTLPLQRGGRERWLDVAGVDTGEWVVYTIRDVTAEHELEQLRHDVVAIVSHELRTPLTGTLGAAHTLLAHHEQLSDDARRGLAEMIVEQGERLKGIVDQMLLASELDRGEVGLASTTFDAAALVRGLVADLAPAAGGRLTVEVAGQARAVGDEARTRQVLTNLVDNALKYTNGPVRVRVEPSRAHVRLTVADEGPGIPPSEHELVFEKFYRLDPGLRHGVGGTGLGLYIARELVTRMQGRIALLPVERGTAVLVELPAAPG